jgi:hypothetical protein
MSLPRRRFLRLVSSAVVLPAVSRIATAQTYPTRSRQGQDVKVSLLAHNAYASTQPG